MLGHWLAETAEAASSLQNMKAAPNGREKMKNSFDVALLGRHILAMLSFSAVKCQWPLHIFHFSFTIFIVAVISCRALHKYCHKQFECKRIYEKIHYMSSFHAQLLSNSVGFCLLRRMTKLARLAAVRPLHSYRSSLNIYSTSSAFLRNHFFHFEFIEYYGCSSKKERRTCNL